MLDCRRFNERGNPIYLELVDFVASGTTPEDIVNFHPSAEAQSRAAESIEREKESQLTPEEGYRPSL